MSVCDLIGEYKAKEKIQYLWYKGTTSRSHIFMFYEVDLHDSVYPGHQIL